MIGRTALVSGGNGQLGSYMIELLLEKGYTVVGLYRRGSTDKFQNLVDVIDNTNLTMVSCDITDSACVFNILEKYKPQEVYNLAAQSFVKQSFEEVSHTFNVDTIGVVNFLEGIRLLKLNTRFISMSTSEQFGKCVSYIQNDMRYEANRLSEVPEDCISTCFQDENTRMLPESPYGIAKLASHNLIRLYRNAYNMYTCANINFNFESKRRGKEFVTRKITSHLGMLANRFSYSDIIPGYHLSHNRPKPIGDNLLRLGNLDASRDWGAAYDVARACWLTLQQDKPDDYVICTEKTRTVRDFCETAFSIIGLDYKDYVVTDPSFLRPSEVDYLCGEASKARFKLNWSRTISFHDLVTDMVEHDIKAYKCLM